MKFIFLLGLIFLNDIYASPLDFVVKVRVEKFQIKHDGDYLGSGQIHAKIFRKGLDPNVHDSYTNLDIGQETYFSVSSGELYEFPTYPNSLKGYVIQSIQSPEDLEKASFDLIVSEEDMFVFGPSGIMWDDKFGFPLIKKNLNFDLKKLLKKENTFVTFENTFSFPEQDNRFLIKIRFSKVPKKDIRNLYYND